MSDKQNVVNPFSSQRCIAMRFKSPLARARFVGRYGMYVESCQGDYVYMSGDDWKYVMGEINKPFPYGL